MAQAEELKYFQERDEPPAPPMQETQRKSFILLYLERRSKCKTLKSRMFFKA